MSNVWMLVVVTLSGDLGQPTTYPTEAACRDALSIARTGMTAAEDQDAHIQWYATHIPRPPKTAAERTMAFAAKGGLKYDKLPYHVTDDGKIQDDPPTPPSRIKSGRCAPTGD